MKTDSALEQLIQELTKLPGVGKKTAERLAFHILAMSKEEVRRLGEAILAVKEKVGQCSICFNLSEGDPCRFCSDPSREKKVICVIEEPRDLLAIERSGVHKGLYHVLHGLISPLEGVGPEELKLEQLISRVKQGQIQEVIVATNPTPEGEATALYLAKLVKPLGIRVTRLAQGIPMGGDLEYTDEATVRRALEGRQEL